MTINQRELSAINWRPSLNKSKRNYGNRIDGSWVFGIVIEKISLERKFDVNKKAKKFFKNNLKNSVKKHSSLSMIHTSKSMILNLKKNFFSILKYNSYLKSMVHT